MPWTMFELYAKFPAFLLVLCRIGGLVLTAPVFSGSVMPRRIKILLTVAVSCAVFPLVSARLNVPVTLASAVTGIFGELVIGMAVGFCITVMFMGVQLAAEFISHQSGMMLGSVYNPMLDSSETVLSQVYYFAALMGFFAIGGHRQLLRALLDSFQTIPPLGFAPSGGMLDTVLDLVTVSFEMAIRVSGPVVIALMLALLALGFLSRTIPQLNILTVGFPLKLGLALLVAGVTIMSLEPLLIEAFTTGMNGVRELLKLPPLA
jgi:flagellar biosynthetic protein FliR